MLKQKDAAILEKDSEEGQFRLLCNYGDVVSSNSIIATDEHKENYFLIEVLQPFPTFEEYSKGEEFDEGEILSTHASWDEAHIAQLKRKV